MMDSEPLRKESDDGPNVPETASCPISPFFVCGFVILFNWDEGLQKPFKLFPRKAFPEITDYCLNKELSNEFRMKKLCPLKPLPGKKMSLFAKVESSKIKKKTVQNVAINFYQLHSF